MAYIVQGRDGAGTTYAYRDHLGRIHLTEDRGHAERLTWQRAHDVAADLSDGVSIIEWHVVEVD